jgi:hypothetical protein
LDELGVGFGEKKIVGHFSAERFGRLKFKFMIVVAELDASPVTGFANVIKEFRGALPAIGLVALRFFDIGADDVALADGLRGFESLRPFLFDDVVVHMR